MDHIVNIKSICNYCCAYFESLFADKKALCAKKKKAETVKLFLLFGPSVEIRTRGLLNPIQARYQTSPHPDMLAFSSTPQYISIPWQKKQALFLDFLKFFIRRD